MKPLLLNKLLEWKRFTYRIELTFTILKVEIIFSPANEIQVKKWFLLARKEAYKNSGLEGCTLLNFIPPRTSIRVIPYLFIPTLICQSINNNTLKPEKRHLQPIQYTFTYAALKYHTFSKRRSLTKIIMFFASVVKSEKFVTSNRIPDSGFSGSMLCHWATEASPWPHTWFIYIYMASNAVDCHVNPQRETELHHSIKGKVSKKLWCCVGGRV